MPRFFVPNEQIGEGSLRILGDDARHIARSLRMAAGDLVTVCDRDAKTYDCRLDRIRDDEVCAEILHVREGEGEGPIYITLYMAYPKGDKLETVIQKAVELGASRIVPFVSSRCVKIPKADKEAERTARLCRIAEEAAKQCGRCRLPEVCRPVSFEEALAQGAQDELSLFCYEGEQALSLKAALEQRLPVSRLSAMVGPEGGFSEQEAAAARSAGFLTVHLGKRILRCETAPSYLLSAVSYAAEL